MHIRPMIVTDIPLLAEFWYDSIALQSQKHPAMRLMPDALSQWQAHAEKLLQTPQTFCFVAEYENEILGCIISHIAENQIGMLPRNYGHVDYLILDLHSPHKRKNAVNALLAATSEALQEHYISHLLVRVATYATVEQGFWRGLKTTHLEDTFWMDL